MRAQTHLTERPRITGVILAGGRGTRMGGADKGLLEYQGRPLIQTVLEVIASQTDEQLIVANRNQSRYGEFGIQVENDIVPGFLGPLAGMLTAAMCAHTPLVLTVPCDVPHLPPDLVDRMLARLQETGTKICIADDGERLHPVVCLWQRALAPSLAAAVRDERLRVRAWIQAEAHCIADFSENPRSFANLNSPADLEAGYEGVIAQ